MDKAKDIKLVILDVDGVMTDGRIVIDDNGVERATSTSRTAWASW
jgi:3-deoxy-D-manno-octulosonate 8-phosphate phosphatase (KDO 8-P phosphatase)